MGVTFKIGGKTYLTYWMISCLLDHLDRSKDCQIYLNKFIAMAEQIGLPIKNEKTVFQTTRCILHGIEVDTNTLEARLPQEKNQNIKRKSANV